MADFAVQRGQVTLAQASTTVTITAGTEYTAPADTEHAFIRIVGFLYSGSGADGVDNGHLGEQTIYIQDPGNLSTSITFARQDTSTEGDILISWEIIEYVGAAGGANEFTVRHVEQLTIPLAGSFQEDTVDTATVSGVVDDNDVVVFLTGASGRDNTETSPSDYCNFTEWISASSVARLYTWHRRIVESSVAVVEFNGSNWTVQRVEHTFTAADTVETETITAVGALSRAFIHPQMRQQFDAVGMECWLSATNEVSFKLDAASAVYTSTLGVAWIIENSQTDGTPMNVQRVSGTRTGGAGGTNPDQWTEAITSVAALATTSIFGEYAATDGGSCNDPLAALWISSPTQVTLERGRDDNETVYRFEVVEWPTVAASALEGYRWRNDDGSETAATWAESQDVDHTANVGDERRLRLLIDEFDGGQVTIQAAEDGTEDWYDLSE